MIQAPLINPFQQSRLVKLFDSLSIADAGYSHEKVAFKIAELINLTDSFALADDLAMVKRSKQANATLSNGMIETTFTKIFEIHANLTNKIVHEFEFEKIRSVMARRITELNEPLKFDPLRRIYVMLQRDMEVHINSCRTFAHKTLASMSDEGAQIVSLDKAMMKLLDANQRRSLTKVLSLLGSHFKHSIDAHEQASSENSWVENDIGLSSFLDDMRSVALAECEHRFQPVLGLLASIEEQGAMETFNEQ